MIKFPLWSGVLAPLLSKEPPDATNPLPRLTGVFLPVGRSLLVGLAIGVLTLLGGSNTARAAASAVYGGGPFYNSASAHITEIENSGFEEAVVWNIAVNTGGDLNFNYEFLLCSNGAYVGNSTHADFPANMAVLKQGGVKRLTFSVGSSNTGVFQAIQSLVNSQGTGSTSVLYRNFQALKTAVPSVDAIDFDDENCYDQSSMVKFAVMLGNLGYKVSLCPYTNSSFWINVAAQVNSQRPGTVDRVHLQCYSGGGGNSPNSVWNFGAVPVHPGLWDQNYTPSGVQSKMATWRSQYQITGGFMWLYDDFVGNGLAAQYASAINNGVGPLTPVVISATAASATTGGAFSYQIKATNQPTSYNATGLPPGLSVNTGTGLISGTPTQLGTYNATISAATSAGTGSAALTITVQAPYTAWQSQYFTAAELNDPNVSGPNATPAGDGIPNLMKYALGLNPKTNGTAGLPSMTTARGVGVATYLALKYTKVLSASDVTYTVEVSGDLQTWSSGTGATAVASTTNNSDGTTQTIVQRDLKTIGSTPARFIRLRVSRQ